MITFLKNTFLHIPGIGKAAEEHIWRSDIYTWEEFLEKHKALILTEHKKKQIHSHILKSIEAYEKKDFDFFATIPNNQHWRAYKELKNRCCFLDIETTGLDKHNDEITLIGMHDGKKSRIFIKGKNMDKFEKEIGKYDLIVTFNGRCFDVPFIKSKFPDINLDKFHVDLRFALRELGYSGGLKRIEKELGIKRDDDLQEVDGFEAVRLWYKYKRGDKEALELLLKYNQADIENLKTLMDFAFEKLKQKHFFSVL